MIRLTTSARGCFCARARLESDVVVCGGGFVRHRHETRLGAPRRGSRPGEDLIRRDRGAWTAHGVLPPGAVVVRAVDPVGGWVGWHYHQGGRKACCGRG